MHRLSIPALQMMARFMSQGYSSAPWNVTQNASSITWSTETLAQNQNANAIRLRGRCLTFGLMRTNRQILRMQQLASLRPVGQYQL